MPTWKLFNFEEEYISNEIVNEIVKWNSEMK